MYLGPSALSGHFVLCSETLYKVYKPIRQHHDVNMSKSMFNGAGVTLDSESEGDTDSDLDELMSSGAPSPIPAELLESEGNMDLSSDNPTSSQAPAPIPGEPQSALNAFATKFGLDPKNETQWGDQGVIKIRSPATAQAPPVVMFSKRESSELHILHFDNLLLRTDVQRKLAGEEIEVGDSDQYFIVKQTTLPVGNQKVDGLFATRRYDIGDLVLLYHCEKSSQALNLKNDTKSINGVRFETYNKYTGTIKEKEVLPTGETESTEGAQLARKINQGSQFDHDIDDDDSDGDKTNNCRWVQIDPSAEPYMFIGAIPIVARREIKIGDELFVSYNKSIEELKAETLNPNKDGGPKTLQQAVDLQWAPPASADSSNFPDPPKVFYSQGGSYAAFTDTAALET